LAPRLQIHRIMLENVANGIERYMSLLSQRQKVVASNIANADTPGYKTKDIDFASAFNSSLNEPSLVNAKGLTTKNDGNNVDLDREARMLAENTLRFNIASTFARSELSSIRAAMQEGQNS
jgi:flagellar basal-body rod protein FlgB